MSKANYKLKFQKLVGVNATYIQFDKTTSVVILMCLNVCVNYRVLYIHGQLNYFHRKGAPDN